MSRMGLCLPKGCKQHHYDSFADSQVKMINGFLDYLSDYYHHPQINSSLYREWTRIGMTLTKSDEYTETWRQRTWPGVIPTAIIVCLIVAVAIAANFIKYY